jgi:hypothetical protein
MIMKEGYTPVDEAHQIHRTLQSLQLLWDAINGAEGFGGLLAARRMCELVLANEMRNLKSVLEDMIKDFPDMEIDEYEIVAVPDVNIN